ncbi:MAG: hypothetical protein ACJ79S_09455 [Gemmatimonadaceae bacterium]
MPGSFRALAGGTTRLLGALAASLALALTAAPHAAAAQGVTRDTTRRAAPRDTTTRRDTTARRDTTTRRDTTHAVPIPPRPDSIHVDSTRAQGPSRPDSARVPRDTIKAPTARAESPTLLDVGPTYRWDRDALFASGAVTLLDFLERVPGLTGLRGGWINLPQLGSYLGNVGAVRVFYDGLELDALDPRGGGVLDLSNIQLWTLEDLAIERGADELRVYLRSWRTDRTTPQTRIDVTTGDEQTNLYRGFYGKRYRHGEALQGAFQQYSTREPRFGGGGNENSLLLRTGIARGNWSVEAFANRVQRTRSERVRYPPNTLPVLPSLRLRTTDAYLRAAYGDPERSPLWAQLVAGTLGIDESSSHHAADASLQIPQDTADTTRSEAQYLAALGLVRGGARLSATGRFRTLQGKLYSSAMARASFDRSILGVSLLGERNAVDSVWRGEGAVRLRPFPFLALSGVASYVSPDGATGRPRALDLRGEGAVRIGGGLWVGGGVLARDSTLLRAPVVFDGAFLPALVRPNTGTFATVRGQLYKAIYADAYGVRWRREEFYQPADQTREEVGIQTRWLQRFPSGNFGFHLAGIHEYRGATFYPVTVTATDGTSDVAAFRVRPSQVLSVLLEIRIVSATLTYQLRNALGAQYDIVPGYLMPRTVNFYGIRWNFAN